MSAIKQLEIYKDGKRTIITNETKKVDQDILDHAQNIIDHFREDPEVKEPEVKEPEVKEPEMKEPEVKEPEK